ncbi:hypothetical protein [Gudongella sp. DL1XJH-153]|uniref:hypothetical protein n=1 Tax=Gudongella sp. DL1XJH-153 TaxID=3409804 RepID=UPI003BB7FA81
MEMNKRLLKIVLAAVGALSVACLVAILYLALDEPVFLKHYYDIRTYEENEHMQEISFNLVYITNVGENRTVTQISFLESPEMIIHASEYSHINSFPWGSDQANIPGEVHGRYSVRTIYCQVDLFAENVEIDGKVLSQANVYFSDGSKMNVDLGELQLYVHRTMDQSFEGMSSSGSSDGSSSTRYRATEEATLVSVESPMLHRFADRLDLKINDHVIDGIKGLKIEEGKYMEVKSKLYTGGDPLNVYSMIDLHPEIIYMNAAGDRRSLRFYNVDSLYHSFNFMDIYRYLAAREVL